MTTTLLPVDQLDPHKMNVRRDVGDVTDLAASIKTLGLLAPIVVAPHPDPDAATPYVILAGHRRRAAAVKAGLTEVPVVVREDLTDEADQIAVMLTENSDRDPLTADEEAGAVSYLLDLGESVATISKRIGWSRTKVKRRAKIAALPDGLRTRIHDSQLSLSDAEFLADHQAHSAVLEDALGTADWAVTRERVRAAVAREAALEKQIREVETISLPKFPSGDRLKVGIAFLGDKIPTEGDPSTAVPGVAAGQTEADAERAAAVAAERKEQEERAELAAKRQLDLDAATTVRTGFLRKLTGTAAEQAVGAFAEFSFEFAREAGYDWLAGFRLGGVPFDVPETAEHPQMIVDDADGGVATELLSDHLRTARPAQIAWTLICASLIENVEAFVNYPNPRSGASQFFVLLVIRYFDLLEGLGYQVSSVERELIAEWTQHLEGEGEDA